MFSTRTLRQTLEDALVGAAAGAGPLLVKALAQPSGWTLLGWEHIGLVAAGSVPRHHRQSHHRPPRNTPPSVRQRRSGLTGAGVDLPGVHSDPTAY